MSTEVNRNAQCPCGSGKKYKNCCMSKGASSPERKRSIVTTIIILLVVFGAGAGLMKAFLSDKQEGGSASSTAGSFNLQPPGPAPEGKEWSVEHGHWHDIETGQASAPAGAPTINTGARSGRTPGPQPDGPVPEGKEWNEEHGHWHNIPGYVSEPIEIQISQDDTAADVDETESEGPTEFEEVVDDAPIAE